MVRALLNGSKTQTRRVVKFKNDDLDTFVERVKNKAACCPYGQVGDQLWVKEAHYLYGRWNKNGCTKTGQQKWRFIANRGMGAHFEAPTTVQTDKETGDGWWKRNSLFMPRWASRITLEITGVRVERLQDISEADATAEGIERLDYQGQASWRDYSLNDEWAAVSPMLSNPIDSYKTLWESLNGAGSWDLNPWVWVIEFKKVKP
jgi:hypothetical protein